MKHRTVAITGATAGIGRVLAGKFAQQGAKLVLIGRRRERLDELVQEFGRENVFPLACDVSDTQTYTSQLGRLPEPFSNIDVLVNNAGIGIGKDLAQESRLEDWSKMVQTNINGLIAGTQALLPGMLAREHGHIINIGSILGLYPYPRNAIYGASKAFVHHFSKCLRADLAGTRLRVSVIDPGIIGNTEFAALRLGSDADAKAVSAGMLALEPENIADAVEWVVSQPAYVNVNAIELMPVDQAFGPPAISRKHTNS